MLDAFDAREDRRSGNGRGGRRRARRAQALALDGDRRPPHRRLRAGRARDDHDLVAHGRLPLRRAVHRPAAAAVRAATRTSWDWIGRLDGPDAPGSWGGHAVDVVGYDEGGLTVVTWGALQRLTWAFWDRYCDEAWCVLSPDFLTEGRSPQGFDVDALRHDLELVTAGVS